MLRLIGRLARWVSVAAGASGALREIVGRGVVGSWSTRRPRLRRAVVFAFGLAATLYVAAALVPKLLVALGRRGRGERPNAGRSLVGRRLPRLSGRSLSGRRITLPDDALGRATCLVLGFSYEARFDVEDWVDRFNRRFGKNDRFGLFELPMIGNVYRPVAGPIEAGMRGGTPREAQDHVVTIYGWQRAQRRALGTDSRSDTWVFALDRKGTVLYQYGGPYDDTHFAELASALSAAAGARAA